ncbi:MAG TPA: hypothetical protein VGL99_21815 [Chloroflexota bacterium]
MARTEYGEELVGSIRFGEYGIHAALSRLSLINTRAPASGQDESHLWPAGAHT